ncbi:MAG: hypothetical protein ACR2P6_10570 [Gammaproteobacteria bacterium]
MQRRHFLALATSLLPSLGLQAARRRDDTDLGRAILGYARTHDSGVGRQWLLEPGNNMGRHALLARLRGKLQRQVPASLSSPDVGELLRRQITTDFIDGRTCNVNGWILAETETELSALASLIHTDTGRS